MIINYSTLVKWKQIQDQFNKGKEVTAFYVSTKEEAEKLKAAIDPKGNTIYIIVDKAEVNENESLEQQGKAARKKTKKDPT